ncbi:hypothetical protein QL285_034002 [Trifolium repens]|nr:hypothetical protein QL285_034002 [Trifolium repens]
MSSSATRKPTSIHASCHASTPVPFPIAQKQHCFKFGRSLTMFFHSEQAEARLTPSSLKLRQSYFPLRTSHQTSTALIYSFQPSLARHA